jgi:hypothetical protein
MDNRDLPDRDDVRWQRYFKQHDVDDWGHRNNDDI